MSLASFGSDVVFEITDTRLLTWTSMRRRGDARYHDHETYGTKPKPEFLGPSLEEITFSARLDAAFDVNPREVLATLRDLRDRGVAERLIVGDDKVGTFTIRALSEDHQRFDRAGNLICATVELTMKEYE